MATDPVCGMQVDESKTADKVQYQGRNYFCPPSCRKAVDAASQKYRKPTEPRGHGPDATC